MRGDAVRSDGVRSAGVRSVGVRSDGVRSGVKWWCEADRVRSNGVLV